MRRYLLVVALLAPLAPGPARAQSADDDADAEAAPAEADYQTTVIASRSRQAIVRDTRAVTVIDPQAIAEAAPRSTSEALHFTAGVSLQKTNHAGGSPYLRGRTGQQTLLLIDGFRLNTSIMRSGPNQYLNTIDIDAVERIEVLRGSGSVLYGSDAIGGVVSVISRGPARTGTAGRVDLRGGTADRSIGGRAQVEGTVGDVAWLIGAGGQTVGDLRGGGPLPLAEVPVYADRTQLFTGYDELAADAAAVVPLGGGELTGSAMLFRQLDAPRTDKCSPDPLDCRFFDEQFYDLAYLRWDRARAGAIGDIATGVAFARTHERRRRDRDGRDPFHERDRVLTLQYFGRASIFERDLGDRSAVRLSAGSDGYLDFLASEARTGDSPEPRGKYLDGSRYASTAAYGFGELAISDDLGFTLGGRLTYVRARVAADPEGGTDAFTETTAIPVASAGVRIGLTPWLSAVGNLDQGFRAPNLDDLTAQSSEGPGYQLANPDLEAETSVSLEAGLKLDHRRVRGAVFAYQTYIDGFITREPTGCPPGLVDECGDAPAVFRLINAESATVHGIEADLQVDLPEGVSVRGGLIWTVASTVETDQPLEPQSKIPPLSGRLAVRFGFADHYFFETIAEYAFRQDRLSPADISDPRIPPGGTPGYGVVHLRAGAHLPRGFDVTVTAHNVTDDGYRVHGSGVDGAAFGAMAWLSARFGGAQ